MTPLPIRGPAPPASAPVPGAPGQKLVSTLVDPFDTKQPVPQQGSTSSPAGGLVDPFDTPGFKPSAAAANQPPAPDDRGMVRKGLDWLEEAFTGAKRTEFPDLPELGTSGPEVAPFSKAGIHMLLGYTLSQDPQGVADIALKNLEGSTKKEDKFGNPIISWHGKDYYINKPGLSGVDLFQLLADAGLYRFAAKGGAGPLPARVGRIAALSAGTSVAKDLAAQAVGSDQPVNLPAAAAVGAGGAAFELLSPVARKIFETVKGSWQSSWVDTSGNLTPLGISALNRLGIDPSEVTAKVASELQTASQRLGRSFGRDAARAVQRQGVAREMGIDLTKGQATQDARQLAREEAYRHYGRGKLAGDIMTRSDNRQTQQISQAATDVQRQVGRATARPPIGTPADTAAEILDATRSAASVMGKKVDTAYALAATKPAFVNVDALRGLGTRIVKEMSDAGAVVNGKLTPATMTAIQDLQTFLKKNLGSQPGARVTAVHLDELEKFRKRLGGYIGAAANPTDKRNLTIMKRQYDRWLDDAFDNSLFSGDPEALKLLKDARSTRLQYGKMFEVRAPAKGVLGDDDAGRLVEKMLGDDVTNTEMAQWLYGVSSLGSSGRAVRLVKRFKDIFGPDSLQLDLLREGAYLRALYGSATDPSKLGKDALIRNLNDALSSKSEPFMTELFGPEDLALIRRLKVAIESTTTPPQVRNPSKSGYEVARAIEDLLSKATTLFMVTGDFAGGAGSAAVGGGRSLSAAAGARSAAAGLPLPPPRSTLFTAMGAATAGAQYYSNQKPQ